MGSIAPGTATAQGSSLRETLSLDGPWQIVFDRKNEGRARGWHHQAAFEAIPGKRIIQVPSCWETIDQDYEGVGWYGRRFHAPASWLDRAVRIRFGAVNYRAEVWINDQPAGWHEAGYTPFVLNAGDLLRPGAENFILVRVIGPIITRDVVIEGIGPNEMPHWRGAIGGGIWQPVELVATSRTFFSDVFVEPDIHSGKAVVHATIVNDDSRDLDAVVQLEVSEATAAARKPLVLRPGNNSLKIDLPIESAKLWSPDQPHLYTLEARLLALQAVVDEVNQRFGMREFTTRENNYYLNGEEIHVRAGFWEGLYPGTLAFPGSADLVRREIRLAKEAGFNVLRPWRKPPPPPILDIADEMGMMIVGTPPIECMGYWPQIVPETDRRVATEIRELILRDRNHPSVVWWELFNEILRPGLKRLKEPMSVMARHLDGSRVVIDESGGWSGWSRGTSAYPPHRYQGEPESDLHSYVPAPVSTRTYEFYRCIGDPNFDSDGMLNKGVTTPTDKLVFMSEMGYGGLPNLPANVEQYDRTGNPLTPDYRYHHSLLAGIEAAMREMRWEDLFGNASDLCLASQRVQAAGNKLLIEALRLNPRMKGYCLHAYTDGDWVLGAGVLDLFRNPKLTYESVKCAQQPLYFALRLAPNNVRSSESAVLRVRTVNDRKPARGVLKIEVAGPSGNVVFQDHKDVQVTHGIQDLLEIKLPHLTEAGAHRVRASFQIGDNRDQFINELEFYVLADRDLKRPSGHLSVLDPDREIVPFLQARGIKHGLFSGNESGVPVIVAAETAGDEDTFRSFVRLVDYVERGGVAVLLKPPLKRDQALAKKVQRITGRKRVPADQNSLLRTNLFPIELRPKIATGNWAPVNHGVREHPVFEGLPVRDFMGQIYQNVCAAETIVGLNAPPIVGSISYEVPIGDGPLLNYHGPGKAWWGADMISVPYGAGQFILSTLPLQESLGSDPVAEKILYNLIRWAESQSSHVPAAGRTLQEKMEKFLAAYQALEKTGG